MLALQLCLDYTIDPQKPCLSAVVDKDTLSSIYVSHRRRLLRDTSTRDLKQLCMVHEYFAFFPNSKTKYRQIHNSTNNRVDTHFYTCYRTAKSSARFFAQTSTAVTSAVGITQFYDSKLRRSGTRLLQISTMLLRTASSLHRFFILKNKGIQIFLQLL